MKTVQDLMIKDLLEDDKEEKQNETLELLNFFKESGVPLTQNQIVASILLNENGLGEFADYAFNLRKHVTPTKKYYKLIDKLTLANRIKGNAKLSTILKANANPANADLKASDVEAKAMRNSEMR